MAIQIPQTAYNAAPAAAIEGMVDDTAAAQDVVSRWLAVADAPIGAGRALVRSTSDNLVKLPGAAGDVTNHFQGVSVYDATRGPGKYGAPIYSGTVLAGPIPCLKKGRLWVLTDFAVTQDDAVYVRTAAGAGLGPNVPGCFGNAADGGACTLLARAKWITSAAANALAVLELSLP